LGDASKGRSDFTVEVGWLLYYEWIFVFLNPTV
jgi:hypothetical protein